MVADIARINAPPRLASGLFRPDCDRLGSRRLRHGQPLRVPSRAVAIGIEKNYVVDTAKPFSITPPCCTSPNDIIPEVPCPEHGVHQQLQVVACRRVTVEVDAPRGLQNPLHLHQPHGHHRQVRLHPLTVGQARGLDHVCQRGLLVGNQPHLGHVEVRQGPGVLERRARRRAAHRGGVVLVRVEGRVEVNQVDALAVHPAQDFQVVAGPDRLIGKVRFDHGYSQTTRASCSGPTVHPTSVGS